MSTGFVCILQPSQNRSDYFGTRVLINVFSDFSKTDLNLRKTPTVSAWMMKTALAVDCPDICLQNTAAY